jgi:hypothetical protein
LSTRSLSDALFLRSWSLTGGIECPARGRLSVVPRLQFQYAKGSPSSGSVDWPRLALDGRFRDRQGGYYEAGLGIGLFDSRAYDALGTAVRPVRGTPLCQFVGGRRFSLDEGPSLLTEVIFAFASGSESPCSLELLAGLSF